MLFQSCFKHFFQDIGCLLAVVTVAIDGRKLAYRIIQKGGRQPWFEFG